MHFIDLMILMELTELIELIELIHFRDPKLLTHNKKF